MHNLEIISLMLRDQEPNELSNVAIERSTEEKERDERALLQVRMKEQEQRQAKTRQYTGARCVLSSHSISLCLSIDLDFDSFQTLSLWGNFCIE